MSELILFAVGIGTGFSLCRVIQEIKREIKAARRERVIRRMCGTIRP
jgi:hypothetical protein